MRSLSTFIARAYLHSMNAILTPVLLIATMLAGPAWAGCPKNKYLSIPKVIDLSYPKARTALIEAGFQPLIDWDRMQHDYDLAEAWIDHANYFEIQACSNTSAGPCREHRPSAMTWWCRCGQEMRWSGGWNNRPVTQSNYSE